MIKNELLGKWGVYMNEQVLMNTLTSIDKDTDNMCPEIDKVFRAFHLTDPSRTQLVIVGQDPYPQKGVATGILFGNKEGTKSEDLSPSLKVLKECILHPEISSYRPSDEARFDPTLESWVSQGILMINSALTVKVNSPGSHQAAWREFTDTFIRMFSSDRTDVIWLFFGAQAASFIPAVQNAACILKCEHPAYFARSNIRMTDDPFARINRFMKENMGTEFKWLLPEYDEEETDGLPF